MDEVADRIGDDESGAPDMGVGEAADELAKDNVENWGDETAEKVEELIEDAINVAVEESTSETDEVLGPAVALIMLESLMTLGVSTVVEEELVGEDIAELNVVGAVPVIDDMKLA